MSQAPDASSRPPVTDAKILIVGGIERLTKIYQEITGEFKWLDSQLMLPDELGNDPMTAYAFNYIKTAMQADPGYAWSWHCNLAVAMMDGAETTHAAANAGAARFMSFCFNVDVTKFPQYQHLVEQWNAAATEKSTRQPTTKDDHE